MRIFVEEGNITEIERFFEKSFNKNKRKNSDGEDFFVSYKESYEEFCNKLKEIFFGKNGKICLTDKKTVDEKLLRLIRKYGKLSKKISIVSITEEKKEEIKRVCENAIENEKEEKKYKDIVDIVKNLIVLFEKLREKEEEKRIGGDEKKISEEIAIIKKEIEKINKKIQEKIDSVNCDECQKNFFRSNIRCY